jgi:hypothetical protein
VTAPAAARSKVTDDGRIIRVYPIPDRSTGEIVELPNISSIIDVLQTFGLIDWKLRMAIVGAAHRDDLLAGIVAAHLLPAGRDRNKALATIIEAAIEQGQILEPGRGFLANDFGTAIHLLTEHVDAGLVDIMAMPTSVAEHAARYDETMRAHHIEIVRSEFTVFSHALRYAGTGDRIIRFGGTYDPLFGELELGRGCFGADVKTGRVKASAAMQLAALVNAEGIFDAETNEFDALPDDLRTDIGFVIHSTAEHCDLIPTKLPTAFEAFQGAIVVKRFVESSPLFPPLPSAPVVPLSPTGAGGTGDVEQVRRDGAAMAASSLLSDDVFGGLPDEEGRPQRAESTLSVDLSVRTQYLRERARKVGADVVWPFWPRDVKGFGDMADIGQLHSAADLDLIEKAIITAEASVGAPFPEPDPSDPCNIGVLPSDARVLDIETRRANLPSDLRPIRSYPADEQALADLIEVVEQAETALNNRLDLIEGALGLLPDEMDADVLARLVGSTVETLHTLGTERAARFEIVCRAFVDERGILIEHDGQWFVDQPKVLLDAWGGRTKLIAAAKVLARRMGTSKPRSCDDVMADPLLVAALIVMDLNDVEHGGG